MKPPLSARKAHGLHKDGCQFVCGLDPDGLPVQTLDTESFLAVNGTQTLSHTCLNLAGEIESLCDMGIMWFRLSPQDCDMVAVAHAFRDVADRRIAPSEAEDVLAALVPTMPFSNGFFHGAEGLRFLRPAAHMD
jgi:collagenase-like PrtC family protease